MDVAIFTEMGNARNAINVLSSDGVIACGMGAGTASEVALALKSGKFVVLLNVDVISRRFFRSLAPQQVDIATGVAQTIAIVRQRLNLSSPLQ